MAVSLRILFSTSMATGINSVCPSCLRGSDKYSFSVVSKKEREKKRKKRRKKKGRKERGRALTFSPFPFSPSSLARMQM